MEPKMSNPFFKDTLVSLRLHCYGLFVKFLNYDFIDDAALESTAE